jgi:hypothetical protein
MRLDVLDEQQRVTACDCPLRAATEETGSS